MQDTSFLIAPIRQNAFFKQAVFERQVGDTLLQRTGLAAQILDFVGRGSTRRCTYFWNAR